MICIFCSGCLKPDAFSLLSLAWLSECRILCNCRDCSLLLVSAEQKAKQAELYKGLDERRCRLESVLADKIKELKKICLRESEISGELPHEYQLFMAPGEKTPTIKKRMGTAFSIAGSSAGMIGVGGGDDWGVSVNLL